MNMKTAQVRWGGTRLTHLHWEYLLIEYIAVTFGTTINIIR